MTTRVLPRRPGARRARGVVASWALALAAALAGLLTGCSDDVDIDASQVSAVETAACRGLLEDLPETLTGEPRRGVDPDDVLGAAWGEPALVLECGTTMPDSFDQFAACAEVDGVQWYVPERELRDSAADVTIHSLGYEPVISLHVPAAYRGRSDTLLSVLGPLVEEHLELVKPCI